MAVHTYSTPTAAITWPGDLFGWFPEIPETSQPDPDTALLALCVDFRRLHAALDGIPHHDEAALDAAWTARQAVAERLMGLRPVTDAGRREKAVVGVAIMEEVAPWQRDAEVLFALAAFRAEAAA